jgi:hypothetical protein
MADSRVHVEIKVTVRHRVQVLTFNNSETVEEFSATADEIRSRLAKYDEINEGHHVLIDGLDYGPHYAATDNFEARDPQG